MNYISAKQVNSHGGLMVEREDGTFIYCEPDSEEHAVILEQIGDDIESYVSNEPSETEILAAQMRNQRDDLLTQIDAWVSNPLRWAEYSDAQKAAFAAYRQALLDVPQQGGFPQEIDWPELVFPEE